MNTLNQNERGATTVEYIIALVAIVGSVLLVVGFLEFSIASRVNAGRNCYTSYEIQDPQGNPAAPCN